MRLTNRSRSLQTSTLNEIAEFVTSYCQYQHLAHICVFDRAERKIFGKGRAHFPSLVEVYVSQGLSYPTVSDVVPGIHPAIVRSWEEEFVLVLAHELRHLDQFHNGSFLASERALAEIDAETVARSVLRAYRRQKSYKEA